LNYGDCFSYALAKVSGPPVELPHHDGVAFPDVVDQRG